MYSRNGAEIHSIAVGCVLVGVCGGFQAVYEGIIGGGGGGGVGARAAAGARPALKQG